MVTFCISLIALVLGYLLYGRFVDSVFGPDDRETPAVAMADGVDRIVLPNWKVFVIQFLNIAGTGPIFGAIMGAKFGPVAYLWIVLGCIFAGSVHDYFTGMLSMRNGGASCPEIVGKYLGEKARKVMRVFSVLLLLMVGTVFVFSPATILQGYGGTALMWIRGHDAPYRQGYRALLSCVCHCPSVHGGSTDGMPVCGMASVARVVVAS